jgi:hypothetical protein
MRLNNNTTIFTIHNNHNKLIIGNIKNRQQIIPCIIGFNNRETARKFGYIIEAYLYKSNDSLLDEVSEMFNKQKLEINTESIRHLPQYLFEFKKRSIYSLNSIFNIIDIPQYKILLESSIEEYDSLYFQNYITCNNLNLIIFSEINKNEYKAKFYKAKYNINHFKKLFEYLYIN